MKCKRFFDLDRLPTGCPDGMKYLYIIECADKVKVGISRNPANRLRNMGTAVGDRVLRAWLVGPLTEPRVVEYHVHGGLHKHRIHGEWFAVPMEAAIDRAELMLKMLPRNFGPLELDGPYNQPVAVPPKVTRTISDLTPRQIKTIKQSSRTLPNNYWAAKLEVPEAEIASIR